ncbi:MAG: ketosteroid isomerase-related protein [Chloroflexota bacterium]|nr:ketosteroid isomerase-related protein [Chloroflexota bacterium]
MVTDVEKMFDDFNAAWNSHDVEKIVTFFTDDGVHEDMATGAVYRGKEELKAFISSTFIFFPDWKAEVKSRFGAGDWSAREWIMSGTHGGDLPGLPATGKKFSVRGASITKLHEGRIRRNTDYWNLASFLQQIGVMPAAPPQE